MLDWLGIPRHCAACEAPILTVWVGKPCPAVVRDRTVPMRLLIIKRDKLGDLLLTRPVLDRARALVPHAEIHLLANDYNAWVASDHPALARTWIYPRVRSGGRVHPLALLRQIP